MDRFFIPRLGILAVLGVATLLIGVIVLRSPDTHANLWNGIEEGYFRTAVGVVAGDGGTAVAEVGMAPVEASLSLQGPTWLVVPQSQVFGAAANPGQRLYWASGCAKCHGAGGQGGAVGPPLAGKDPQITAAMARIGPGDMPAFTPHMLSDQELGQIGDYVSSLEPATPPPVTPPIEPDNTPSPTPLPTPTPQEVAPSPVPTTASPAATPEVVPPTLTTTSPTPEATPLGNVSAGNKPYTAKCAACHGSDASGKYGPPLLGLDPQHVSEVVRQGKGAMPAFGPTTLPDRELEDIVAYIHSLAPTGEGNN